MNDFESIFKIRYYIVSFFKTLGVPKKFFMAEEVIRVLNSDQAEAKLPVVQDLSGIPTDSLEEIFNTAAKQNESEVREACAKQIVLCPRAYKRFIFDPESSVRIQIVKNSVKIREAIGGFEILDCVSKLATDRAPEVRRIVASVIFPLIKISDSEEDQKREAQLKVVPAFKTLFADEDDGVRINAASHINDFTSTFGFDYLFTNLSDSIHSLYEDKQWRIRIIIVNLLVGIGLATDSSFVDANILPLLSKGLKDNCEKVRLAVADGLVALTSFLGLEWLQNSLFKIVSQLEKSQSFLDRKLFLVLMVRLIPYYPPQYQSNMYRPIINLLQDPVNNVTLTAITVLSQNISHVHPFRLQHEVKPILEKLVANSINLTVVEKAKSFLQKLNKSV